MHSYTGPLFTVIHMRTFKTNSERKTISGLEQSVQFNEDDISDLKKYTEGQLLKYSLDGV